MLFKCVSLLLLGVVDSFTFRNGLKPNINMRSNKIVSATPSDIIDLINSNKLGKPDALSYNELMRHLNSIKSAVIVGNQNTGLFYDNNDNNIYLFKYLPNSIDNIIHILVKKGIDYQVYDVPTPQSFEVPLFIQIIMLYLFLNYFMNKLISSDGPINPFNRMNKDIKVVEQGEITTTFIDVAGLDEAKEELEEIVDYLRNPLKYTFAGAKIPKGVLLEGPPGTGKTLMARAVAGEAGVSFLSTSGSEFIEMFVGVGAQRVRNLFNKAKENKPCVIFIDEIDAIGGKRGYGINSGGNDEREQTLNQILTNMDGFEKTNGIIVLAATNRADILDPALKRSGRFDRKITIPLPDFIGRKAIANIHFKNKQNVTLDYNNVAALTQGFSGSDLETLANEAALLSVRNNLTYIDDSLVLKAYEKMTIGLPKKYDNRKDSTLKLVAYHEIGHALVVKYFKEYFNLQKITLNANTVGAGGYTLFTPNELFIEYPTKGYYLAQIIIALGGRAAEILLYKNDHESFSILDDFSNVKITSGASSDLKQANTLARTYIFLFENYIINENNQNNIISDNTRYNIDNRVNQLINECLNKAINIIEVNEQSLYLYANKLMDEKIITF